MERTNQTEDELTITIPKETLDALNAIYDLHRHRLAAFHHGAILVDSIRTILIAAGYYLPTT